MDSKKNAVKICLLSWIMFSVDRFRVPYLDVPIIRFLSDSFG